MFAVQFLCLYKKRGQLQVITLTMFLNEITFSPLVLIPNHRLSVIILLTGTTFETVRISLISNVTHFLYCQAQPKLQVQLEAELALISISPTEPGK